MLLLLPYIVHLIVSYISYAKTAGSFFLRRLLHYFLQPRSQGLIHLPPPRERKGKTLETKLCLLSVSDS